MKWRAAAAEGCTSWPEAFGPDSVHYGFWTLSVSGTCHAAEFKRVALTGGNLQWKYIFAIPIFEYEECVLV